MWLTNGRVINETEMKKKSPALSTQGFDVTPELLQEHKETTQFLPTIPVGDSSILRAANPRKCLLRVLEIFRNHIPPKSSSSSKPKLIE
jgi:hypothetical protein